MRNATHTHTAKIVSALAGLSISASLALAEQSGAFVGVEVGYGEAQYQVKNIAEVERNGKIKSGGVYYGLVAGYKHFFTPYLGLRSYVNFDVLHTKFSEQGSSMRANLFTYGVNVDFLGNFLSTSVVDFGGFVGLWLGGNTWQGKDEVQNQPMVERLAEKTTNSHDPFPSPLCLVLDIISPDSLN